MIISFKAVLRLAGMTVVAFCAVFVCTFFLNYYLDAKSLGASISGTDIIRLYNAQMATAKLTCLISGGFLALIAVVMLVFYIKLYIDGHSEQLGILKALGYSEIRLASRFWVFGLSVLVGAAFGFCGGYIIMPTVYNGMTLSGLPEIKITFHFELLILLVFVPAAVFCALACLTAYFTLKKPVSEMLCGKQERYKPQQKQKKDKKDGEHSFLAEMCFKTLTGKKLLAFFVTLACFSFSAMVQMSVSMLDLSSATMGGIILGIGLVLAVTTLIMALTTLINANVKNIALMKAFGYTVWESALSVLGGYHIFAFLGFAAGTAYQYGLLSLMVNIVYKNIGDIPEYGFDIPVFFITLAVFIVLYEAITAFYALRMSRIPVKSVTAEN